MGRTERLGPEGQGGGRADALARMAALAERARPVALAEEQVLPLHDAFAVLLPGGLRRGSTVQVHGARAGVGSTSLALALAAGPSAAGSWVAAVGVPSLGLAAAAGFGVDLARLVLVAEPEPAHWATVTATLLDAFDLVLARPVRRVGSAEGRRLTARARERGSVLVRLGPPGEWPEAADVSLTVTATSWEGLGQGHGHLRRRRATVEAGGRRGADRLRRADLWLPGPSGVVAAAEPTRRRPAIEHETRHDTWPAAQRRAATADTRPAAQRRPAIEHETRHDTWPAAQRRAATADTRPAAQRRPAIEHETRHDTWPAAQRRAATADTRHDTWPAAQRRAATADTRPAAQRRTAAATTTTTTAATTTGPRVVPIREAS